MTLILGMSKPEGIYICVDYRVSDARTRVKITDSSIKLLTIHYAPITGGGPQVLMAFTGLAQLRDGTPMLQWIRETLRGENEVIDQSMSHLRSRLDRDIAPYRAPLIINALVLEPARRILVAFSNLRRALDGKIQVTRRFEFQALELHHWTVFANGSGGARAVADGHIKRLNPHLGVVPRAPMNHMKLLASVNRQVAARESTVSPFCQVGFISAVDRFSSATQGFVERGEAVPFEMPFLLAGLDLTGSMRRLYEAAEKWRNAPGETQTDADLGVSDDELRRRP